MKVCLRIWVIAASTLWASGIAYAGCSKRDYHEYDDGPWFNFTALAFSTVPSDAGLLTDPLDVPIEAIQQVFADGSLGPPLGGTDTTLDIGTFDRWRPDAAMISGNKYRLVFSRLGSGFPSSPDGRIVDFAVDDSVGQATPDSEVVSAHAVPGGGDCSFGGMAVTVAPWDGDTWLHEIQTAFNPDFVDPASSVLTYDSGRSMISGTWVRTRTWGSAGEPGEWSEPVRVRACGCAETAAGSGSAGFVAILSLAAFRRRRPR